MFRKAWLVLLLLVAFLLFVGFEVWAARYTLRPQPQVRTIVRQVTATPLLSNGPLPTATPALPTPSNTPDPTKTATARPTATVTPATVRVARDANLRTGPGTNFALAGSTQANTVLEVVGRNEAGDWYRLANGAWVFSQLVDGTAKDVAVVTPEPTATVNAAATSFARQSAEIDRYKVQLPQSGQWFGRAGNVGVWAGFLRYAHSVGYWSASQGRFLVMSVRVNNESDDTISVNPLDFTLVDTDGQTYAIDTATFALNAPVQAVDVMPGDNAQGGLVFLMAAGVAPDRLIFRSGILGPTVTIELHRLPDKQ